MLIGLSHLVQRSSSGWATVCCRAGGRPAASSQPAGEACWGHAQPGPKLEEQHSSSTERHKAGQPGSWILYTSILLYLQHQGCWTCFCFVFYKEGLLLFSYLFCYPPLIWFFGQYFYIFQIFLFSVCFCSPNVFCSWFHVFQLNLSTSGQCKTNYSHYQPSRKNGLVISDAVSTFTSSGVHFFPWQTLSQSMRQADLNFEKLKTESERLEQHTKKSVNWLLWLMLILVSFTFISMILFIRIFPRLRWWAAKIPNS